MLFLVRLIPLCEHNYNLVELGAPWEENKRNFLEVSGETVERVDPIFFFDPMTAAMKALGMT